MKRWEELQAENPALAEAGRKLIYQEAVGLGYLATRRADGGLRIHPVCPVLALGGLYVFIGNHSPKLHDLRANGLFALHTFPVPDRDDEFFVAGRAVVVADPHVREVVYQTYTATGASTSNDTLFELLLERALHAEYQPRPWWPPDYTRWAAEPSDADRP